jgi:para-nitrobenzyl esterase
MKNLGLAENDVAGLVALPMDKLIRTASAGAGVGPVTGSPHYPKATFAGEPPPYSADVPLVVGSVLTELTFFPGTPLDPIDEVSLVERLKDYTGQTEADVRDLIALYRKTRPGIDTAWLYQLIGSDWMLTYDQQAVAAKKAAQGKGKAYVYQMHKLTSVHAGKLHAPHCIDVPYFFDNLKKGVLLTGPGNQALADKMSATLAAFARTGDPNNAAIPKWESFSADKRTVLIFDDKVEVQVDPRSAERVAITTLKSHPPVARA